MAQAKHTPTPWTAGKIFGSPLNITTGDTGKERFLSSEIATRDKDGFLVVIADVKGKEKISEANAAFIVKAVNCHEMLVEQVKLLEQSLEYEIKKDVQKCDVEGAGLKHFTLMRVREVLAATEANHEK